MANNAVCTTCHNSYDPGDISGTHPYRHPVNGPLVNAKDQEKSSRTQIESLPADPVLRVALIEKGILDPLDLTKAEQMLAATGMYVVASTESARETRSSQSKGDTPDDDSERPTRETEEVNEAELNAQGKLSPRQAEEMGLIEDEDGEERRRRQLQKDLDRINDAPEHKAIRSMPADIQITGSIERPFA